MIQIWLLPELIEVCRARGSRVLIMPRAVLHRNRMGKKCRSLVCQATGGTALQFSAGDAWVVLLGFLCPVGMGAFQAR